MIGKLIGALIGRKAKEKIVDAVLDQVDLPPQIEGAIETSITGSPADLVKSLAQKGTKQ